MHIRIDSLRFLHIHSSAMSTLFLVQTCHVYRVPPRTSAAGYRAAEWGDTSKPLWTGRLRVLEHADLCEIRLEDASSGMRYFGSHSILR